MTTDEPRTPGILTAPALNRGGIRHAFFTRVGGCSDGVYGSLNCSYLVGDDPARVSANRATAVGSLGLPPDALASLRQIHSSDVVIVGSDWTVDRQPEADALVTRRPGFALGVLGADCAPVLFADVGAQVVGAAHAGWRGAMSGVLENTIAAMTRLGARPERIVAAVGPCIGPRSYEVGPEFPVPFLALDADDASCFVAADKPGHFLFDLPGFIARRLARQGVSAVQAPCDTFGEEERFFSHRRSQLQGQPTCGRALSVIFIEG